MCQTLAQGGKRCDTHKDGSKATVSLTSIIADVQEKIVRKVFTSLKKEGKGLDNPEKEEVVSYAETGKFLTKHDPNIPERQKKTIMNQFEKAKEEEPSGPLFHAWKHTLPETLRRTRKSLMAVGLAGAIMATSACGGGGSGVNVDSSAPNTTSAPSISAPANPSPQASPSVSPGSIINGIPTLTSVENDGKGEYIKTTLADDDPSLKYNPEIVDAGASNLFSPEEISDAQKTAMKFVAEETIDSSLNGNPSNVDKWWKANKDKFEPTQQGVFLADLNGSDTSKALVLKGDFRQGKYDLNYGPDKTHVLSRTITPTHVYGGVNGQYKLVRFDAKANFSLAANVDGKVVNENIVGDISYTLTKDASSGKWLISGYTNTFNITPVK